jgi:hypothetical protein
MKNVGSAAAEDDIELEDTYHDLDPMESVAAIDFEVDYLSKLAKTIRDKDERDFYNDKVDSLKSKKSMIETNIANNYVTPESYIAGVKAYLAKLEKVYKQAVGNLGKSNKHVLRLEGRLKVVMKELKDMQDGHVAQQSNPKADIVMKVSPDSFLIRLGGKIKQYSI